MPAMMNFIYFYKNIAHSTFVIPKTFLPLLALFMGVSACSPNRDADGNRDRSNLPAFSEVTENAGLAAFKHDNDMDGKMFFPEQMGSGGGFLDYNNDGWLDIILVGGGTLQYETHPTDSALSLYRNNGDETFSLVTKEAGLGSLPNLYGIGVACADYDNDGDTDLFYTSIRDNFLFRNDHGKFTNVTQSAGIDGPVLWSSSAIFFDADKDGWLDLFVCNYADWSPETDIVCKHTNGKKVYCSPTVYHGVPSTYYHNNRDGTFSDRTFESGFWPFKGRKRAKGENAPGKSLGVTEIDFNRDTWPDLVIANDGEGDLLYVNQGDGTFQEEGMYAGFAYAENGEARAGMGIAAGVTDTSGLVSIFVGNFSSEMIGVYQYTENGWFRDRSSVSKIGRASLKALTFGLFLQDLDFDGDLDLFAANGHVYPMKAKFGTGVEYQQESQIYLNDGYGSVEMKNEAICGVSKNKMVARAAAYGDFNNDGTPDILLTENG